MESEFEKRFLRQSRYWINSIKINALALTLDIELVANHETQQIDGRIRFEQIAYYEGNYHEYEGACLESKFDEDYMPILLGTLSCKTAKGKKYIITTDTIEINLVTKKEPIVFWVD